MCISGSDTCSEFQCPKSVIKGHLQSNVLHKSQAHRPNLNSLSPPNLLLVLLDPSCLLFLLSASTRKHRNHPRPLSCPRTFHSMGPLMRHISTTSTASKCSFSSTLHWLLLFRLFSFFMWICANASWLVCQASFILSDPCSPLPSWWCFYDLPLIYVLNTQEWLTISFQIRHATS